MSDGEHRGALIRTTIFRPIRDTELSVRRGVRRVTGIFITSAPGSCVTNVIANVEVSICMPVNVRL